MRKFVVSVEVQVDTQKSTNLDVLPHNVDSEYIKEMLGDVLCSIDHAAVQVSVKSVKEVQH